MQKRGEEFKKEWLKSKHFLRNEISIIRETPYQIASDFKAELSLILESLVINSHSRLIWTFSFRVYPFFLYFNKALS